MSDNARDESSVDNSLVTRAAEIGDPRVRRAFLQEACGTDERRFERLERLVGALIGSSTQVSVGDAYFPSEAEMRIKQDELVESRVGRYRLLEKIGAGGFGDVYRARQDDPVRRNVALKIIKLGMDTREVVARFDAERQAMAMMDHPCIAQVFDAGETEGGRPYVVMELVAGTPITRFCDEKRLSLNERLNLFTQVCLAVQHAHQKGIIHRDLKPSNILVTESGGDKPLPKIIDFGIAKAMHQDLTAMTLFTRQEQFIGTPVYMSPEQARGGSVDIDTRSDIYSLGVLLYELLVGRTPFDPDSFGDVGYEQTRKLICEADPLRPSSRIAHLPADELVVITDRRATDATRFKSKLRGDLDWIVMKALEKERDRRYDTANGFAIDIKRFLGNQPVSAAAPSRVYLIKKFARRNRAALAMCATVAVLLLAATAVSTRWAIKASEAEKTANDRLQDVERARLEAGRALNRSLMERAAHFADTNKFSRALAPAIHARDVIKNSGSPSELATNDLRLHSTLALCPRITEMWFLRDRTAVNCVEFHPDGERILVACDDGSVRIFQTGFPDYVARGNHSLKASAAFFDGSGDLVVSTSDDESARLWKAALGSPVAVFPHHPAKAKAATITTREGKTLVVTGASDGHARIFDPVQSQLTGKSNRLGKEGFQLIFDVDVDPTATLLAAAGNFSHADILSFPELEPIAELPHRSWVYTARFSPDGEMLATSTFANQALVWDADTWSLRHQLNHPQGVRAARFSPDGRYLVTTCMDFTARVWNVVTGEEATPPMQHETYLTYASFCPDGRRVTTCTTNGVIRIWSLASNYWEAERGEFQLSSDREHLIERSDEDTVVRRSQGREIAITLKGARDVVDIFGADGVGRLLTLHRKPGITRDAFTVRSWDRSSGSAEPDFDLLSDVEPAINLSTNRLVTAAAAAEQGEESTAGEITVWELGQGKTGADKPGMPIRFPAPVTALRFNSANPTQIAVTTAASAWLVDLSTRETVELPHPNTKNNPKFVVHHAEFSPDGRRLITSVKDNTFTALYSKVWDAATGRQIGKDLFHNDGVVHGTFNFDATLVATSSEDKTTQIWSLENDVTTVLYVLQHGNTVYSSCFSDDGSLLVTTSRDGMIRVWDSQSGTPVTPQARLPWGTTKVLSARFLKDGDTIFVTCEGENNALIKLAEPEYSIDEFLLISQLLNGQQIDEDGIITPISPENLKSLWDQVKGEIPDFVAVDSDSIRAWHQHQANRWIASSDWRPAKFHLERELAHTHESQKRPVEERLREITSRMAALSSTPKDHLAR